MNRPSPLLVVGIGNASRGDDALGPLLLDALRDAGADRDGGVELQDEYQLQVEHALDLVGRDAVLYVDASHAAVAGGAALMRIAAETGHPPRSHALLPAAVLGVYERLQQAPAPPAWLLAIGGVSFELGDGLSEPAREHLRQARGIALQWLRDRRSGC